MITLGLAVLVAMLIAGGLLLAWGLRGPRVGQEPLCRACGYILTGLVSGDCPECGTEASGRNVVIGARQRSRRAIGAGAALLLVSLCGLGSAAYMHAKGVNWYPHLPTFLLMSQARGDDRLALGELMQRYSAGSLPSRRLSELVPVALERQGKKPTPRTIVEWTDLLAAMDCEGYLTKEQHDQFYDQMVSFEFKFRRVVQQGERLETMYNCWSVGSSRLQGTFKIEDIELRIGDWAQYYEHGSRGGVLLQAYDGEGGSAFFVPTEHIQPGSYRVEVRATKVFSNPDLKRPITQTFDLEILPPGAPDPVRLVRDPTMAAAFRKSITITTHGKRWTGSSEAVTTYVKVASDGSAPMSGTFKVFARLGDHEVELGTCIVQPGGRASREWGIEDQLGDAEYFVPILRTSSEVARRETTDVFEVWDGELQFDPVKVNRVPQPSTEPDGKHGDD